MKPSPAANLALGLVVIGWLLAFYGALSQLGDPAPGVSLATIEAHRQTSAVVLLIGIVVLLSSLWLSGYSFGQARRRASIAAILCVAPVITIYATTFLRHIAL
jgi:hypothetical protein